MKTRKWFTTRRLLASWLFAVSVAPAAAVAQSNVAIPEEARTAPLDQPVPVSPDVIVGELDNGLRYYIRENAEPAGRAQFRLVVKVGSVVEDDDQLGLAHVLEHMAFNGTRNFEKQELVSFLESIGMRLGVGVNAATGFDMTSYRLELPTDNPEHLRTAFRIMEDWADGLLLDPAEVDQERSVVIEEWRVRRGAGARVSDQQYPVIFRGSRYADRHPIGTVESIETFDHAALRRFYEDWYRPDLMAVIAVGDFDAEEIERLVIEHFEHLENPADPRPRPEFPVPDHEETLFSIVTDPELTSTSVSVYHKMDVNRDWTIGGYRRALVENLYNSMLNERFREIALKPGAPFLSASSSWGELIDTKAAYVLSARVPEGGVEEGLRAVLTEAERVARYGFTESELERAKTEALRGIEQSYRRRADRTSSAYAEEYTRAFLTGESIPGIEYEYELYQRFIPEITLEDVNALAREWVRETNRVVLVTAPASQAASLPDEGRLAGVLASVADQEITPYEDGLAGADLLDTPPPGGAIVDVRERPRGIIEWTLENGVEVVLKPTDFDEDQILFRAFSPGGTSLVDDEDYIPARTAAELIAGSGLGDFNAIELDRVLTGTRASARPFITELEEGLSGSASRSDLETMFQLIYLTFTRPRADEEFFQVWMTQARQALANRDANPGTAWADAYQRLMTGDHPRARPFTLETLEQVDLQKSFEFYRDRFADASDFTFVFVGSFDPEELRPLVEQYLGSLPSIGRVENWRDHGIRTPRGVHEEVVRKGLEPQSQTVISFTGGFDYDDQSQRVALRALAFVLDTRLMEEIREQLGGTYTVSVSPGASWRPRETYQMDIIFPSDPQRVDELVERVFDSIERLKESGPTQAQVVSARESLLREFETDFQENATWLSQLVSDYQRGVEPGAAVDTYEATVRALDAAAIQEAARRFLDRENYVRVTLMPE